MDELRVLAERLLAEERAAQAGGAATKRKKATSPDGASPLAVSPFRAWYWRNVGLMTEVDRAKGLAAETYCFTHGRALGYYEQRRGAYSVCVPIKRTHEPNSPRPLRVRADADVGCGCDGRLGPRAPTTPTR